MLTYSATSKQTKKRVLGVRSPCVKTEKIVIQLKFTSIDRSLHKNQEYVVYLCGYLLAVQQNDRNSNEIRNIIFFKASMQKSIAFLA